MSNLHNDLVLQFEAVAHSSKSHEWIAPAESVSQLNLPFARSTSSPSPVRDAVRFVLPGDVSVSVNHFTMQAGGTLFEVLGAAWAVLLHRYSGQTDFAIATVLPSGEISLLRCEVQPEAGFIDVLQSLRAVELIRANGVTHANDLVHVGFVLEQPSLPVPKAAFTLCLAIVDSPEGLQGTLEYAPDLFDRRMMERVCGHFEVFLRHAVQDPARRIADLPLLTDTEKAQLQAWNDTATDYTADKCIHELFEEQVVKTPDAIAVEYENERLTYAELNTRANQLAHYLRSLGVGPEVLVGLCVERLIEMVVGIAAILKAGGAYVPLDPAYPAERIAFMLADTRVPVLLTQARIVDKLPKHDSRVVCMDADALQWAEQPNTNPKIGTHSENLAYVIYTSGSTGKPKGVSVSHRGLPNMVRARADWQNLKPGQRMLFFASIAFDASVFDLFTSLAVGTCLVIASEHERSDMAALSRRLVAIDIAVLPPAILPSLSLNDMPAHASIALAGEACASSEVERWSKHRTLLNLYGPTEATVWSTAYRTKGPTDSLPIGRPIDATSAHVVDARGAHSPVGVPGELCIAGIGLARGYLNRPSLTAERFVPNPFGPPGSRMYRTGDLARWNEDGQLEFLGRVDHQVKIRGFRIELGEIEFLLSSHSSVRSCVVLAREDVPGDKRLVAYVVPRHEMGQAVNEHTQQDRLNAWQNIYENQYATLATTQLGEDFGGWNSSYDGDAIPLEQMREWRDATVARILSLRPKRVLEIGVGSALLMARILPHCESYWGTDISTVAIDELRRQIKNMPELAPRVVLRAQPAHDTSGLELGAFDTIVINSVIQYFPNRDYLTGVIERAFELLAPGGSLFIGDVRNLHLLPCFTTAIQIRRADDDADIETLRRVVERAQCVEKELLVAPEFFYALTSNRDDIGGIDIQIKRGKYHNELSRYRYEVVIHKTPDKVRSFLEVPTVIGEEIPTVSALNERLQRSTGAWRWSGVPNQRIASEVSAWRALDTASSLRELREILDNLSDEHMDAEEIAEVAKRQNYWCGATWSAQDNSAIDILFVPFDEMADGNAVDLYLATQLAGRSLSLFTNDPSKEAETSNLMRVLREHLEGKLPEYMIPAAFVPLESMPLTPSGKIDRKALPAPDGAQRQDAASYVAPRNAVEKNIVAIWEDLLGVKPIGVTDDFFAMGGHSLLATRFMMKLEAQLGAALRMAVLFEHPTVEALAKHIEAKDALHALSRVPRASGNQTNLAALEIPRVDHTDGLPLSWSQEQIWLHQQYSPGALIYNEPCNITLPEAINPDVFESALRLLLERHESLRTRFDIENGIPSQRIAPLQDLGLSVIDLRHLPQYQAEIEAIRLADIQVRTPFRLETELPIRFLLVCLNEQLWRFFITAEHLVFDGVALAQVFMTELDTAYRQLLQGRAPVLPRLRFQFRDWLVWSRSAQARARWSAEEDYWKAKLAHLEPLNLPIDHLNGDRRDPSGHRICFSLSARTTQGLRDLAKRERTTLFTLLAACFKTLLFRWTQQRDVAIATVVAGRNLPGLEQHAANTLNTLLLRTILPERADFKGVLAAVRTTCQEAFAHQEIPFQRVSRYTATAGTGVPFQVFFVLEPYFAKGSNGWEYSHMENHAGTTKTDLTFELDERPENVIGRVEYRTSLFKAATIEGMIGHFHVLLESILERSARPVADLNILTDAERAQFAAWNNTATDYPADKCIHELFEEQVVKTPDAIAAEYENERLTYAELNTQANQLAHHLRSLGVGPEVLVGLCVERSIEMVVGILAILKAGGAYVPLDPTYPQERIAFMLVDSHVPVLLTQARIVDKLPEHEARVVQLDVETAQWANAAMTAPASGVLPENVAYVIYTSGSTGRPKGVSNSHRAPASLWQHVLRHFEISPTERILQFGSISFDVSVLELTMAFAFGATLIVAPLSATQALQDFLSSSGTTVACLIPPVLDVLQPENTPLRIVVSGGDKCTAALARRWVNTAALFNTYGPTEVTAYCLSQRCSPDEFGDPSLGTPNSNTQAHTLDRMLTEVPLAVAGELYVAGTQLARGYLNRPGLTAEKFVPNPFGPPGSRMYRTGDLARWNEDGQLEFLGRIDHQVKVRGFRIELGEIESLLSSHASVGSCVVLAREDVPGDKRLVAYVVPNDGECDVNALRDHLKEKLPDYMVPAAFVVMESLPLTPNGKIDRKALPAPDSQRHDAASYIAPRNAIEHAIISIWEELLGVKPIGVTDDFFVLGGHSLLAVRFMPLLKAKLGMAPPMATLFQHTTVQALAQHLEGEVQAILYPTLRADGETAFAGLSGTERRLWFLHRLNPDARSYQVPLILRIRGEFDESAFRFAVRALAERHEILRTTYPEVNGVPVRVVAEQSTISLRVVDADGLPESERARFILKEVSAEIATAFDLACGPLTRALCLRLSADEQVVVLHQHHIVTDEWSSGLMLNELSTLYEAARRNEAAHLPALAYQYADYAQAEITALESNRFAASRRYWKEKLAGVPRLTLPIIRPATRAAGPEAHATLELSLESSRAFASFSREFGCTPFMAWYALFSVLLARYSQETDIAVGAVIANRDVPGTEQLLGFFTNTVVLRTDLSGDPSVRELLGRARQTAVEAYRHQALPFDVVVQDQGIMRRAGETPFYDVSFFEVTVPEPTAAPSWSMSSDELLEGYAAGQTTAKDALGVAISHGDAGTNITVSFDTTRVERSAVDRLLGHLRVLVTDALAHPDKRLSELNILTEGELAQFAAWNDTAREYPADKCIHELFEEQVAKTPDAIAVIFENKELTYGELNTRANQLAHHLRSLGVGPEVLVGLCAGRSVQMIVGFLAILKAGGVYLPLDPAQPRTRLTFILDNARPLVVMTLHRFVDYLPSSTGMTLCLDTEWPTIARSSTCDLQCLTAPHNLAYVIFTSGSTGEPKGVLVEHAGLPNLAQEQRRILQADAENVVLATASFLFDASIWDFVLAFFNGARLCLASDEIRQGGPEFVAWVRERAVTNASLTPSMLAALSPQELPTVRSIITTGEACTEAIVAPWRSGRRVFNGYGPTEATIGMTLHHCAEPRDPPPIGQPFANVRVNIVDSNLYAMPVACAGELCIAGIGLARGYHRRPGLTAERFVPDPFSPEPGARMYRTGDLARWNEDGQLEFLGRIDHQVKIRGFRIELGEIESLLLSHSSVRSCVVLAREDVPGDKRLVAYLVPNNGECDINALRDHLKAKLPDYMIPAAFVVMESLPLTPNGKVDRKALPAPDGTRATESATFQAPRTATEWAIASIWEELLGVKPIGITDDFFVLGGHSLLAVRFMSLLKAKLDVAPPMVTLFQHSTVQALAQHLEGEVQAISSPALRAEGETAFARLSGTERRLWFLHRLDADARSYQVPNVFRIRDEFDISAFRLALQRLAERHEILRTTYPQVSGVPVRVVAAQSTIPLRVVDASGLSEADRASFIVKEVSTEIGTSFDLERGPLTRAICLHLSADDHVVVLHQHHIITDEWSGGVMMNELSTLYEAARRNEAAHLPALLYQYADYAQAETKALEGNGFAASREYWKEKLAGVPRLTLPIIRPASQAAPGPEAYATLNLSPESGPAFASFSREFGCTPFMAWYALFSVLLARYSQETDIAVGAVIANRDVPGTERLLGFFTNTVVLRTDLSGNPSVRELLGRARQTAVDAYRYQALPFDVVVQDQGIARRAGETPFYDVSFFEMTAPEPTASSSWSMSSDELFEGLIAGQTSAKDALGVAISHGDAGASILVSFDTARVERSAIDRLLGHLRTLVTDALDHPDKRMSELNMLTDAELAQFAAWNETAREYPADRCIHELFEEQVVKTPEAIAVEFETEKLTYAELNTRANQLAHYLRALGVGPEVLVGLCVERSIEMVVGVLAILKAGGAYVPLDPDYPEDRLGFMIHDAHFGAIVTRSNWVKRLDTLDVPLVVFDDLSMAPRHSGSSRAQISTTNHLAYVVYTSGSTGRPKGVSVPHASLVSMFVAWRRSYGLGNGMSHLQMANFSFDVFSADWVRALCSGGRLVICPRDVVLTPEALYALIRDQQIDVAEFLPAVLRQLVAYVAEYAQPPIDVKLLITGSDLWTERDLEDLRAVIRPWTRVVNTYGVAEAAIDSTFYEPSRLGSKREGSVPVGRPFDRARIYALDHALHRVPIGIPGELYIGGSALARGYQGKPGSSTTRFVPDPFCNIPGARMYRTGDLGRWNEDGNLEFLGRVDHQVKIRGFRIELGEIEFLLSSHSSVRACVVLAREDVPGDKRLVAYVAPNDGEGDINALRDHLKAKLPDYMIPAAFVLLESLPLSPNGKIDRMALPAPDDTQRHDAASYVAPRNVIEHAIASIWEELLGVKPIGVTDDFFVLGGHSLLSAQMLAHVRERLRVEVPVRALFEQPTIEQLAQAIEKLKSGIKVQVTQTLVAQLERDAILVPTIVLGDSGYVPPKPADPVLLTGATGFVGAFLLRELLLRTRADIHCLVRAATVADGHTRIERVLADYGIWQDHFAKRIIPVPGDLARPRFGLAEAEFDALAGCVRSIYHNGAEVNFVRPYHKLRAANVMGTLDVLRLACQNKTKAIHYVSTLSVFPEDAAVTSKIREDDHSARIDMLDGGYSQSKWVAEQLVRAAGRRGIPVTIHRPGTVSGHSISGAASTGDMFNRLIKGCVQLGCAPQVDLCFPLVPVDYVASAIVELSLRDQNLGKAFHLVGPQELLWLDVIASVQRAGFNVSWVSASSWLRALREAPPSNALAPLLPLFYDLEEELRREQHLHFDDTNTRQGLAGSGIDCPSVDTDLLDRYIGALIRCGFLGNP